MSTCSSTLTCRVALPDEWYSAPEPPSIFAGSEGEQRQFSRRPVRIFAAMQHTGSLPSLPRSTHWQGVYIRDISFGGIGFFHSEQIYPTEQVRIYLPDDPTGRMPITSGPRLVEIMRCRRVKAQCYLIGGMFVDQR